MTATWLRAWRPISRVLGFCWRHLAAISIPIISLVYGVGDSRGTWDEVLGRTQLVASVERLASGEGYPVTFLRPGEPDFDPLWRFISSRTKDSEIVRRSGANERPKWITRLGGGEAVIATPKDFPKAVVVPRESPVLFVYDLSASAGANMGAFRQAATLKDLDDWIKSSRERERMIVSAVLINLLSLALVIHEKRAK